MIETTFFSTYFLPGILALIMLGMGMSLTGKDFKNILLQPKPVILGLFCQMILLPGLALGLAGLAGLPPKLQVGLVLISACPGGASSNLISYLLKGNVALSVSMTSVNSFLTILTIPTIVNLALKFFLNTSSSLVMPFGETVLQVLLITVLPCVLGLLIRYQRPQLAFRLEAPLKRAMPVMLAVGMLAAIFLEKKEGVAITTEQYLQVLPWALALNFIGMFGGWGLARLFGLGRANRLTIGIEVGLQNSGLAIAVAASANLLGDPVLAIPASVYALFSFFTAILFGLLVNRREVKLKDIFKSNSAAAPKNAPPKNAFPKNALPKN